MHLVFSENIAHEILIIISFLKVKSLEEETLHKKMKRITEQRMNYRIKGMNGLQDERITGMNGIKDKLRKLIFLLAKKNTSDGR